MSVTRCVRGGTRWPAVGVGVGIVVKFVTVGRGWEGVLKFESADSSVVDEEGPFEAALAHGRG